MGQANPVIPAEQALSNLMSRADAARTGDAPFAGNVTPAEAYAFLKAHPAIVIDVRTLPEWQFTGIADLAGTQGKLATISWKRYPDFAQNDRFVAEAETIPGIGKDTPLLFICRSGGRSTDAAIAMTAAGYRYCFNIEGGFEGEPDANGHRGTTKGWKASQLPWKQG